MWTAKSEWLGYIRTLHQLFYARTLSDSFFVTSVVCECVNTFFLFFIFLRCYNDPRNNNFTFGSSRYYACTQLLERLAEVAGERERKKTDTSNWNVLEFERGTPLTVRGCDNSRAKTMHAANPSYKSMHRQKYLLIHSAHSFVSQHRSIPFYFFFIFSHAFVAAEINFWSSRTRVPCKLKKKR